MFSSKFKILVAIFFSTSFFVLSATSTSRHSLRKDSMVRPELRQRDPCGYYDFGLSAIDVVHHRSLRKDTIYGAISVVVGNTTYNATQFYGRHGDGTIPGDISLIGIPLGPNDVAILTYIIINSSKHPGSKVETELEKAAVNLAVKGVEIANDVLNNGESLEGAIIGQIVDEVVGTAEEAVLGIDLLDFVGLLPLIGITIAEILTSNCDGFLAAGLHAFTGAQICGNGTIAGTDVSHGVEDQKLFGFIPGIICSLHPSLYDVSWYAEVSEAY